MTRRGAIRVLSIAPMMERTDRHFRFFFRQVSRRALLYTEMVPAKGVILGDRERLLAYDDCEHPLALQVGGDDPAELAECARIAEGYGYDEINLNVGCPSPRVQTGNFGACLMATPHRVAAAVEAMRTACTLPVTVKHRIGIDDKDRYEDLLEFVDAVAVAGADRFTVHARKAWLHGLSPKENRTLPPLRYHDVRRLKRDRSHLAIELNGGLLSWDQVDRELPHVDAIMVGRWAYDRPWDFARVDQDLFGATRAPPTREEVVDTLVDYGERLLAAHPAARLGHLARHVMGLYAGEPGARAWRRILSQRAFRPDSRPDLFREAMPGST